jgi:hypothetical protein
MSGVAACRDDLVASGQGSIGDIYAHAAPGTSDKPNFLVVPRCSVRSAA